jgi:hypothetical protein
MIKTYTDLEQSKKLAGILPIESADMHYNNVSIKGINYIDEYRAELMDYNTAQKVLSKYLVNPMFSIIPCWSLAALLNILPYPQLSKDKLGSGKEGWMVSAYPDNCRYDSCWHDNPVDACVEMVLKLHKLNLL